jgi:signal transduction histidine kinase
MLDYLVSLCGSGPGLAQAYRIADIVIALAYFSIPISMLWVLRRRSEDLPYPGLWIAFVLFIFACGGTHALHAISAGVDGLWLPVAASLQVATALISIATAAALNLALPKIADLPSPRQQRAALEIAVAEATRDKDALLLELHHQVGNQLAKLGALVRLELRAAEPAALPSLARIQELLEELGDQHHELSSADYRQHRAASSFYDLDP